MLKILKALLYYPIFDKFNMTSKLMNEAIRTLGLARIFKN